MKSLTFILFVLLLTQSCDQTDSRFKVINNAKHTISAYLTVDSGGNNAKGYYEKLYFVDPTGIKRMKSFDFIKAGDTGTFPVLGDWDSEDNFDSRGNIYIYIIDSADIGKDLNLVALDSVVRRYHTTLNEMRMNGWCISVR